jgi:N-sulfoglucosamine sulfohydrolase
MSFDTNAKHLLFLYSFCAAAQCATLLFANDLQASKPNFVVFISDDHSQLDSQAYGATDIVTPNMTKLAANGMRFTHAFVASPACGPSRNALLTGLWPARNGAEPNHRVKRAEVASLPPILRELGYEFAVFGKVAHGEQAKAHGFEISTGPSVGISDTQAVAKFLSTRDATKPLCMFVGTRHPHVVWSDNDGYDPLKLKLPSNHIDTPEMRAMRAKYLTDVTKADKLLGEVRDLVDNSVKGETLFAYTADHGAQLPFAKWNLYDAGVRVPLIIAWSGKLKPGSTSDAMVCWPDLLPTMIELGGGTVPQGLDGRSFAGLLLGKTTSHREHVFATHSGDGDFNVYPIRALRTQDWKYIRNLHPEFQHQSHITRAAGSDGLTYWTSWVNAAKTDPLAAAIVKRHVERPAEELYDLRTDPFEQTNLAADPTHAERLARMSSELDAWMLKQGDQQEVFGKPLLLGEPVTEIVRPAKK